MRQETTDNYLQRGPAADLWRHTLAQIPSMYGRLVYLSSLRGPGGVYEHHGFTERYGSAAAQAALSQSHTETFDLWLSFTLEQQKADVDLYLSDLTSARQQIVESWLRLSPFRYVVPASTRDSERRLFLCDFEVLLEMLRRQYQLGERHPEL